MSACLRDLFDRHEMNMFWGIYLIHHHWEIRDGEVAVEDIVDGTTPPQYTMKPMQGNRDSKEAVPITYAVHGDVFQALEFSVAPYAFKAHELLKAKPQFLAEFYSLMTENDLAKTFGLGVVRHVPDEDHGWIEFTAEDERLSIMRYMPRGGVAANHLTRTSWTFSDGTGTWCNPNPVCSGTNCYSPDPSRGHMGFLV